MNRLAAAAAITLIGSVGAYSQVLSLEGFQSSFEGFAGDLAGALAVNSTIGSNWSDAYIGHFPNFGVGATVGAAFVNVDSASSLFDAMGATELPSALKTLGIPIPAVVATAKIGIPFLPIDVGIKGGYIPSSVGENLKSSTGVSLDYKNIGLQVRYALVKQNLLLPNVSIGASYNHQEGSIIAPSKIGPQTFNVTTDQGATSISASDPELALGWTSNVFNFTLQVSKQLLFIVPYAGAGYTVGKSSVTGGVSSKMSSNYSSPTYGDGITGLNSFLSSNGGPELTDQGFTYSASSSDPVLRVYGGLSLRIIVLDIDTQVMYVPDTKALGLSATARIQL
jgi:hypothetical protein